jgi:putative isomerase
MSDFSIEHSEGYCADFRRISELMQRGINKDRLTGRMYFTGYEYCTLYDWDQYFEAIVQLHLGWETSYIKSGVLIFLDTQREDGFITRRVPAVLAEERHLLDPETRGIMTEEDKEMVKPFLSQLALLVYKHDRDLSWITGEYYRRLKNYLRYWMKDMDKNGNGLATWNSGPHSGMDDQVERLGRWRTCKSEGVDLNCFLAREYKAFAILAEILGHADDAVEFSSRADRTRLLIRQKLWCDEEGFFYDLDERTGEFIRVKSSAGFAPLWAGAATPKQAERIVREHLLNPKEFWRAFPVPSYAATEPGYREARMPEDVGCNWRAQTWISVNYYLMHGLLDYGYREIAEYIATVSYRMVKQIGDHEYYNTDSCTGNGQEPFWGWSLLAYFMPLECETGIDPTSPGLNAWDVLKCANFTRMRRRD